MIDLEVDSGWTTSTNKHLHYYFRQDIIKALTDNDREFQSIQFCMTITSITQIFVEGCTVILSYKALRVSYLKSLNIIKKRH